MTANVADPALIRGVALFAPVAFILVVCALRKPGERELAGAIPATAWNLLTLPAVNILALNLGWWEFHAQGAVLHGLPVDLLLGWALLWGALPALLVRWVPVPLLVASAALLDLGVMPFGEPVVVLSADWLAGEAVGIALCLVPGLLLARWTATGRRLPARVLLQIVLAGGLGLALPVLLTGVWRQPGWLISLFTQVLAVPMTLGLAAVREFAVAGQGTPLPYDPPVRLVTTGPYAYVRNPMQVSMTAGYLVLAPLDPIFLAAAGVAFAYGAGLAAWHEGERLAERFGREWHEYRRAVRAWIPRWRPSPATPAATVYVAWSCGQCGQIGHWIQRRRPVALTVAAAEDHPGDLVRMAYERSDGFTARGVAAWAHVLTHVNLGWAVLGWLIMTPGLAWFAQLCVDAFGGGPRRPPRTVARSRP
ncbi:methyltransferase family protein [Rhizohabitans arisaemae]|uniref:methyltransferase family protein n=1 Tax=Rhizohabitans arisaemae TaxID=2720610 RepID=UPI0024B09759|nr:isoprenylcysteine carboxylmethyltransferase family protein [Rhizohabitans arisaemae]